MADYKKRWVKCNANDAVRFRLRAGGRKAMLERYSRDYMNAVHPGWEQEGTQLKMQLWQFMNVLGPMSRIGVADDFDLAIELEVYEEDLKEALNATVQTDN